MPLSQKGFLSLVVSGTPSPSLRSSPVSKFLFKTNRARIKVDMMSCSCIQYQCWVLTASGFLAFCMSVLQDCKIWLYFINRKESSVSKEAVYVYLIQHFATCVFVSSAFCSTEPRFQTGNQPPHNEYLMKVLLVMGTAVSLSTWRWLLAM